MAEMSTQPHFQDYQARWRKPKRIFATLTLLIVLALLGLMQACSTIKIAYNQSPELTYWYLDDYIDFTPTQSALAKSEMKKIQAWHRQSQLPIYAEELRQLQPKMLTDISAGVACSAFATARVQVLALMQHAEPALIALAATIDAAQTRHLSERFDKSNKQYRKEWLEGSVQKKRAKRLKDALGRAEKVYGSLDERQTAWLGQRIDASPFDANINYAERLRRQQDALQTLQTIQANPARIQNEMQGFLARALDSPNPAFRSYTARLMQENCQTFADLHGLMNANQRAKAQQVIQGYEQDFKTLGAQ